MDEEEFSSLSQGVFVVPFQPNLENTPSSEAGPSRVHRAPRKLQKVYELARESVQDAQEAYEQEQVDSQLDDVRDWLEACDRPSLLKLGSKTARLKVAVLQSNAVDISSPVANLVDHTFTLHGREVSDLSSAIRDVATGLSDGAVAYSKTSGTAGLEALSRHMREQKFSSLLHIAQAQALPQNTTSELLYTLSRHPSLSLRVLLSVPSASLFVSSLRHVDHTALDLSILRPSGTKRRNTAETLYKSMSSPSGTAPLVSQSTVDQLQAKENQTGGGVLAASKALKWLQLRASESSRLATTMEADDLAGLQAIVDASRHSNEVPWEDLLDPEASAAALEAALDAGPRISILKSLADHRLFVSVMAEQTKPKDPLVNGTMEEADALHEQGGSLDELQKLFELYGSAGRTVNLWDWLQGFEDSVARGKTSKADGVEVDDDDDSGVPTKRKRADETPDRDDHGNAEVDEQGKDEEEPDTLDETEQDRLHSTFIRFCEEARMMGLLRARGRGKVDEVVKGTGFA